MSTLNELVIAVKSGGEIASAVICRLHRANFHKIVILETDNPKAVRRGVSFCEAVHEQSKKVEGVEAVRAESMAEIASLWNRKAVPVVVDPDWNMLKDVKPDVLIDAIIAKRNLGTSMQDAALTIGLGPGFTAGKDVHFAIETNRGHDLGRIIKNGSPCPDTGIPGVIEGFSRERVLRAPAAGIVNWDKALGDIVEAGEPLGYVNGVEITASISGLFRGQIRAGSQVKQKMKIGDIDPRGDTTFLTTVSDKGRAIGGAVLEGILRVFNCP